MNFKLIDRYIGKQVLFGTTFGVAVLSIVLVLGSVFQRLVRELDKHPDIGWGFVAEFMLNVLPYSLIFTVPWGFLTAILLSYGRLSADNELTSLRMSGLSMPRICAPVFAIAILLTAFTFWMNVDVSPKSKARITRIFFELATENPGAMFVDDEVVTALPGHLAYSKQKYIPEGAKEGEYGLLNFQLIKLNERKRPESVIIAQNARIALEGENKEILILDTSGSHMESGEDDEEFVTIRMVRAETANPEVPLDKLREKHKKERPSMMTISELLEAQDLAENAIVTTAAEVADLKQWLRDNPEIDEGDQLSPAEEAAKLERREKKDLLKETEKDHERAIKRVSALKTEHQKRYSLSLACLTFALIGIPLGITAQRRETSVGFAISLVVAIGYFLFLVVAEVFHEDPGAYPWLLIWLPNVIFLSLGIVLFYRLSKR